VYPIHCVRGVLRCILFIVYGVFCGVSSSLYTGCSAVYPIHCIQGVLKPGDKAAEAGSCTLIPFSTEVENEWSYTWLLLYAFMACVGKILPFNFTRIQGSRKCSCLLVNAPGNFWMACNFPVRI
jgi:hypothetical protein